MSGPAAVPATGATAPRVWLVIGDKLGDNAQVEIIAEALGWPCERKQLAFKAPYILGKPRFEASLYHLDSARSAALEPPWPELVISVGRRPAMAALWIREQSGGRTKLVLLGRPKRWLERFDVVIAPVQYQLPERPNVLHLALPLMRNQEAAIVEATALWRPRLEALPQPLIALLVGGPTKPFMLDAGIAKRLLETAAGIAAESGGTVYVTTSRRTPAAVADAMRAALPPGARMYRWTAAGADNPYLALLGLAERFIVTGDSISMLVEVARLGKPLAIFPLPSRPGSWVRLRQDLAGLLHRSGGALQPLGDALYRWGLVGYSRDLPALHRWLMEHGLAVRLGEPFRPPGPGAPDELPRVVERIRALFS